MNNNDYSIFKYKNKEIISITNYPKHIKKQGYKYYPFSTVKKKLFNILIRGTINLKLDKIIANQSIDPVPQHINFNFANWMKQVEDDLGYEKLYAIVRFPSQIERKRFYVNLLAIDGSPVGFAKVSLDNTNDQSLIKEAKNISRLLKTGKLNFKIPNVISSSTFNDHHYLIFESFSKNAKNISSNWNRIYNEYIKDLHSISTESEKLINLLWWNDIKNSLESIKSKRILNMINDSEEPKVKICLSHGDLHSGNVIVDDETWIFDWEDSSSKAPILTDETSFYLGKTQKLIMSNSEKAILKLLKYIDANRDLEKMRNLALSLAYLYSRGREDAKLMIHALDDVLEQYDLNK